LPYIRPLEEIGPADLRMAGGKAVSLGQMLRAELPVPPGFVLLTSGYAEFLQSNRLAPKILSLLERLNTGNQPGSLSASAGDREVKSYDSLLEEIAEAIRELFAQGSIPATMAEELAQAYRGLGEGRVAVRSSATAEDLPGASFAGQHESYLNVVSWAGLLDAVKNCWASLWTPRALSYRRRQGFGQAEVALAVVVQRLVDAEAAGVLFTANPVTGRRNQMTIDAVWGLGEALVGGRVTPDHWVVDSSSAQVLETKIARKELRTVNEAEGTTLAPVPQEKQMQPVLTEAQIAELVALGRQVQDYFGSPQDIEWAWTPETGGRFYLVQSRPITSLFPLPVPPPPPGAGLRVYICGNNLQGIAEPLTPMGISVFRLVANGVARMFGYRLPPGQAPAIFTVAAGRIFIDATEAFRSELGRKLVFGVGNFVDRPTGLALQDLAQREPRLSIKRKTLPIKPPALLVARIMFRFLFAALFPNQARKLILSAVEKRFTATRRRADVCQNMEDRRRFVEKEVPDFFPFVVQMMAPLIGPGILLSRSLVPAKVKKWLGDAASVEPLLRSLPHNPTTEMDLALWQISRQLLKEGVAPSPQHPAIRAFLEKYGHRGIREIDVGMPRWRDDPAPIIKVLETYLTHGNEADPEAQFDAGNRAAQAAAADLVRQVRRRKGLLRAWLLQEMISRLRALGGTREYPKFMAVRFFALFRDVLLKIGEDLVRAGRLDQAEDIFFLEFTDLDLPGDLRPIVQRRRADYERELGRREIPKVITSEGETIYAVSQQVPGALIGMPVSAGVYEGRVKIIFDPRGARLEPGEILVAPGTDPAWTPLFFSAGALVMEIGGVMSHGSIVAREYGIPAVVGVVGATRLLRNGQKVRVDGTTGLVVPLEMKEWNLFRPPQGPPATTFGQDGGRRWSNGVSNGMTPPPQSMQ